MLLYVWSYLSPFEFTIVDLMSFVKVIGLIKMSSSALITKSAFLQDELMWSRKMWSLTVKLVDDSWKSACRMSPYNLATRRSDFTSNYKEYSSNKNIRWKIQFAIMLVSSIISFSQPESILKMLTNSVARVWLNLSQWLSSVWYEAMSLDIATAKVDRWVIDQAICKTTSVGFEHAL